MNDRSQGGSDRVDDGLDNPSDHTGEAITTLAGPGAGAVTLAAAGNELETNCEFVHRVVREGFPFNPWSAE